MNSLIEVTQTVLFTPARLLGQVEYSASSQGQAPGPLFWIFYLAFLPSVDPYLAAARPDAANRGAFRGSDHG